MPHFPTPQNTAPPAPVAAQTPPSATEMYEAARLARQELRNQVSDLRSERRQLQEQIRQTKNPTDLKGLETRLTALDARIADVEKQLAQADALVANRAAVPGVIIQEPSRGPDPESMAAMGMVFSGVLLFPLVIAYARRIWRRGAKVAPALPTEIGDRLANMERGIEAVAIEVERLGEGQRFVTQLLSETEKRRQVQALPVETRRD